MALLAAAEGHVDYVVTMSGPGVSLRCRTRGSSTTCRRERSTAAIAEALAWIDERSRRFRAGEPVEAVLADQLRLADRPWYAGTTGTSTTCLRSVPGPAPELRAGAGDRHVRCPVLALFGADDTIIPVGASVDGLPQTCRSCPAIHTASRCSPEPTTACSSPTPTRRVPRTEQLAPGFMTMFGDFVSSQAR